MDLGILAPVLLPLDDGADPVTTIGIVAAKAEEAGFTSLWVPEHVVSFDVHDSQPPYSSTRSKARSDRGLLDPFVLLAYLAARTHRIRLGTAVCILPQRNAVYVAKEGASLDVLSRGRLDFGVGVGWVEEEFAVVGASFASRGRRADLAIDLIRRLWSDPVTQVSAEDGRTYECRQYPNPRSAGGPRIFIGGNSARALRRVAQRGDGWFAFNVTPSALGESIDRLTRELIARGRGRGDVHVAVCGYLNHVGVDELVQYRDAGADHVALWLPVTSGSHVEDRLATMSALAAAYREREPAKP